MEKTNDQIFISQYQKLSGKFMEKYENKIYWDYAPEFQQLSEKLIEKCQNKIVWGYIS
jgi:hypothetical protein